jgi:cbb3-type cytochrome oxidase subunit 3
MARTVGLILILLGVLAYMNNKMRIVDSIPMINSAIIIAMFLVAIGLSMYARRSRKKDG